MCTNVFVCMYICIYHNLGNFDGQKGFKNYFSDDCFSYSAGVYKIFIYKYLATCTQVENGNVQCIVLY